MIQKTNKYPCQTIIIGILLLINKTIMSFRYRDQTFWLVYITVGNLDANTRWSQKRPGTLFLRFIYIIHEELEDKNNKNKDLKIKIYHIVLKTRL